MSSSTPVLAGRLVSRTRRVADLNELLDHLGEGGFAWLRQGAGFVTSGVAAQVTVGPGAGRFREAAAQVAELLGTIETQVDPGIPGAGPRAVGTIPFADGCPGRLIVPGRIVGRAPDGTGWVTETMPFGATGGESPRPLSDPPSRFALAATESPDAWAAKVTAALDAIEAGSLAKVVLARDVVVEADRPFDARAVLAVLQDRHPSCFTFAADGLVGATPELLVERRGHQVISRPVAGTAPVGRRDHLCASPKELAEHGFVVDAVVDALRPWCDELVAPGEPGVMELANVLHLATTVRGRLADPLPSALTLAGALHPTPAVGGVPGDEALRAIATFEHVDRGCYTGPVGWVDAHGDGEWAVALRCAEIDGRRARLFAGAGIVAGSEPEAEWAETQGKLEAMLVALVRP